MLKFVVPVAALLLLALYIWSDEIYTNWICGYIMAGSMYCPAPGEGKPSPFLTSKVTGEPKHKVSALFIGSSFTYTNDLPGMLVKIASSDPLNTTEIRVQSVTKTGAHLKDMWDLGVALKVINSRHWDYIVLQEHPAWTFSRENIEETSSILARWAQTASEARTKPVFFENWADKPGSSQYTDVHYHFYGRTADVAQQEFSKLTSSVGKYYKMDVALVGDFWSYTRSLPNAPELYTFDSHNPGPAGTYLSALVFYRYFTGNVPINVAYRPAGVTSGEAQFLLDSVSK